MTREAVIIQIVTDPRSWPSVQGGRIRTALMSSPFPVGVQW